MGELRLQMTKSSKLASELIAATGLCCLRCATVAGHSNHSRITVGVGISDRLRSGCRLWFRSQRAAERVVTELNSKHGMRRGSALVVEATPEEAAALLLASARLLGVSIMDDDQVDSIVANLTKRIEIAIAGMGREGTLQRLRQVAESDLTGLLQRQV